MKFLDGMLAFEHGLEGGDRVFTRFVCIGSPKVFWREVDMESFHKVRFQWVAQGILERSRNGELEN